jgi:hypothetical protein
MTVAADALRQAGEHGVVFLLEAGRVRCRNGEALPDDLFRVLYERLPELREILAGDRCKFCGAPIGGRAFDNVVFADATAACLGCYERAEAERLLAAGRRVAADAVGTSDEGEVVLREDTL